MSFFDITLISRIPRFFIRKYNESVFSYKWRKELDSTLKENKLRLSNLRNKHLNQPCVLIGGGPSINKMDLNDFKDMVSIACNGFYLKHSDLDYQPTYYTVEDPLPAADNTFEILSTESTKIIPYDLRYIFRDFDDSEVIYCNFRRSKVSYKNKSFPLFSDDFLSESYWGGTVMYLNIQLAHYLGCNPIYICGVDLSYTVPNSVVKKGAVLESTEDDNNHFDPRYFGKGKKWHLPETDRMQQAFTRAYEELGSRGVKLINIGIDSKLDVIPKKNYKKI